MIPFSWVVGVMRAVVELDGGWLGRMLEVWCLELGVRCSLWLLRLLVVVVVMVMVVHGLRCRCEIHLYAPAPYGKKW